MLKNLHNINHRIYYHGLFWLTYYIYRVMIYGDVINTFENVAYVQAFELMVKLIVVYTSLYWLKPRFFDQGKYFFFAVLFLFIILSGSYLQLHIIHFCIKIGIYHELPLSYLFSIKKYVSATGHISMIAAIAFGIKVMKDAHLATRKNAVLVKEKLETELQFLKGQINPHFFFNTLNNIYSLIIKKSDKAGEVVLKLSELMSYMIYEAGNTTVLLRNEIDYLRNYIELERLRYRDHLEVNINVNAELGDLRIAPLILLPFVENAFKHGMDKAAEHNFLNIDIDLREKVLFMSVKNSVAQPKINYNVNGNSGIGLQNVRRRLQLLYANRYKLDEQMEESRYTVELQVELINEFTLSTQ